MIKHTWAILIILLSLFVGSSYSAELKCLDASEGVFVRSSGQPVIESLTFPGLAGPALITIRNGATDDTLERVSSSVISVNGIDLATPDVFNQNVGFVELEVELFEGDNELAVQLMGKPGGIISIEIIQEVDAEAAAFIGSLGGTLEVTNQNSPLYQTKLIIPEGAIDTKQVISISIPQQVPVVPTEANSVFMVELLPHGLSLLKPVVLLSPPDQSFQYRICYAYNEAQNSWTYWPTSYDNISNRSEVEISHFSFHSWWEGLEKQCEISWYYFDTTTCPSYICPIDSEGNLDDSLFIGMIEEAMRKWEKTINNVVHFERTYNKENADLILLWDLFKEDNPNIGVAFYAAPLDGVFKQSITFNLRYTYHSATSDTMVPAGTVPFREVALHELGHTFSLPDNLKDTWRNDFTPIMAGKTNTTYSRYPYISLSSEDVDNITLAYWKENPTGCSDTDNDYIPDYYDNCPVYNPLQTDTDSDGIGNVCDGPDEVVLPGEIYPENNDLINISSDNLFFWPDSIIPDGTQYCIVIRDRGGLLNDKEDDEEVFNTCELDRDEYEEFSDPEYLLLANTLYPGQNYTWSVFAETSNGEFYGGEIWLNFSTTAEQSPCEQGNLDFCIFEPDCESAGGYWWSNNTCHSESEAPVCIDSDDDGFFVEEVCGAEVDCDDTDSNTYPGAIDVCYDGIDNNCDGDIDEGCGDDSVLFPDPNLEQVIREKIQKPTGMIYVSDLENITELFAFNRGIADISGLQYCINLIDLNLNKNNVSDLSPVAQLTDLQELSIWENKVLDLTPLINLSKLRTLWAGENNISNLAPLAELDQLIELSVSDNQVSDLSPLSELINLTRLGVAANNVSDLAPIADLTNLWDLGLSENQISDISPLYKLTNLTRLSLDHNSITDISPLSNMLRMVRLYLDYNQIVDLSPLAQLINIVELDLSLNTGISDLAPLNKLTSLQQLTVSGYSIYDLSPLSGMNNLVFLGVTGTNVSNLYPLLNLSNIRFLNLGYNQISDISMIKDISGISSGDRVDIRCNSLNDDAYNLYIPELQNLGVTVYTQTNCY
ncbi:leucine-rich repeat domain-containing protein [Desulfopila sp. IMCC35008]|uniref:leucine-rich repeat domain-containing protein n=1 Tax=Desulfopila sp. IMCC35008 TaxID=2653858 RepID=UPI0013D58499|nr:leucine-rich repeat domain-containing protein [Desulfopila sp. IMCC35008]